MVSLEHLERLAAYVPSPVARAAYYQTHPLTGFAARRRPAVVLFTDISGFTPLSELLGQIGPTGAEEMTQLINQYFTGLIQIIEAYQGQVVNFFGDSLTVLFPADEVSMVVAARRAGECGLALQAAMPDFTSLHTSRGQVALSIKVSIGAGEVLECSVGGFLGQWEYVMGGDPLIQVAAADHLAEPGQVMMSRQAWAAAGEFFSGIAGSQGPVRLNGVWELLPAAEPPRLDWSRLEPKQAELATGVLAGYVPSAIRARLAELPDWLAELRRMTILFAGIGGFDYEAADACDRLQDFLEPVQALTDRFEGILSRVAVDDKGTVLLILFGAPPFAHEDDASRAVAFALRLQGVAQRQQLHVSIGISQGSIFAGPVGAPSRQQYTVIGDEANLASRLMQYGRAGAVIIDQRVKERAGSRFITEDLGEVSLKGKTKPLAAYLVNGEQGTQEEFMSRYLLYQEPLVGRKAELEQTRRMATRARAGKLQVCFIEGELGLGKSRLISEVVREWMVAGGAAYGGRCLSYGRDFPYQAWREVLAGIYGLKPHLSPQRQLARLATEVAEIKDPAGQPGYWTDRLPLLAEVLGLDMPDNDFTRTVSGQLRRDNTFALIEALLRYEAENQPLLIVLESIQWADELSLSLLVHLTRTLTEVGLLLVLGHRPMEAAESGPLADLKELPYVYTLGLEPLSAEESQDLLKILWGSRPLPAEVEKILLSRGQGNPFFLHEISRTVLEATDSLPDQAARPPLVLDLPDTVQDAILTRVDRLREDQKLTLKVAAVIGTTFQRDLLSEAHPAPQVRYLLPVQLGELEQVELITLERPAPEWEYAFRNVLTQEVVYEGLLLSQRRHLHAAVGAALEKLIPDQVERLAFHYNRSDDLGKAVHYLKIAGHRARREYANQTAIAYYSEILAWLTTPRRLPAGPAPLEGYISADYWDILLQRARLYNLIGWRDEELEDLGTLGLIAEALDDDQRRSLTARQWAYLYEKSGDYDSSLEMIERCVVMAQSAGDERLAGQGYNHWGRLLYKCGEYGKAQEYLHEALLIAQRHNDKKAQAESLGNLGLVAHYQNDYKVARYFFEEAIDLYRALGDQFSLGKSLSYLGRVFYGLGQYSAALNCYNQSLTLHRTIGDREGEALTLQYLGQAYRSLGSYTQARKLLEQALAIHRAIGNRLGEVDTLAHLGFLYSRLAEHDTALELLETALANGREFNDARVLSRVLTYYGWVLDSAGRFQEARKCFEEALKVRHDMQQQDGVMMEGVAQLGRVALALRDFSLAYACARRVLRYIEVQGPHSLEHPAMAYLTCYHILQANHKFEQARSVLGQGQAYVATQAGQIEDLLLRHTYLNNVSENRMIQELALGLRRPELQVENEE